MFTKVVDPALYYFDLDFRPNFRPLHSTALLLIETSFLFHVLKIFVCTKFIINLSFNLDFSFRLSFVDSRFAFSFRQLT